MKREKAERPTEWQEWQKAAAPPETDPARKFYTSLLQQIPSSEMAKRWCLRFGVLPPDQAKVIWAELEKKGKSMGKSPAVAVKTKPRLAKVEDEEDEEDERPKAKKAPRSTGAKSKRPNEDDDDDDDDESDEPIVKKGRVKKEAKASVKKPVAKKDVAFDDGGLGEDDDDDKPILAKAKKANPPVKAQMPAPLPPAAQDDDDSDDLPLIKRAKA